VSLPGFLGGRRREKGVPEGSGHNLGNRAPLELCCLLERLNEIVWSADSERLSHEGEYSREV